MAFYAYHGHRLWRHHRGHGQGHGQGHGYHHNHYDHSYNDVYSEEWRDEYLFDEDYNLDLSSDNFLPRRPPACNPEDLTPWDGPSDFSFSPDDFGVLVISQKGRSDHGNIFLRQSPNVSEVTISVSILVADDNLASGIEVIVHKDEDKGVYVLDVRSPFRRIGSDCIKLAIDITFPPKLESFKTFVRGGNVDIVAHSVSNINFEDITLETFNGTIDFSSIWATEARFYTFYGQVKGSVYAEKVKVSAFVGKVDIEVNPDFTPIVVVAKVGHGSVHVKVPGEFYSGFFKVATYVGQAGVEAEDADSLVIEKSKPNLAVGYYKEKEGGKIIVLGGAHSVANLTFL